MKLKTEPLEEAVKLLTTLLEGWEVVAREKQQERFVRAQSKASAAPQGANLLVQVHG